MREYHNSSEFLCYFQYSSWLRVGSHKGHITPNQQMNNIGGIAILDSRYEQNPFRTSVQARTTVRSTLGFIKSTIMLRNENDLIPPPGKGLSKLFQRPFAVIRPI